MVINKNNIIKILITNKIIFNKKEIINKSKTINNSLKTITLTIIKLVKFKI
jgi:hypothetical protein